MRSDDTAVDTLPLGVLRLRPDRPSMRSLVWLGCKLALLGSVGLVLGKGEGPGGELTEEFDVEPYEPFTYDWELFGWAVVRNLCDQWRLVLMWDWVCGLVVVLTSGLLWVVVVWGEWVRKSIAGTVMDRHTTGLVVLGTCMSHFVGLPNRDIGQRVRVRSSKAVSCRLDCKSAVAIAAGLGPVPQKCSGIAGWLELECPLVGSPLWLQLDCRSNSFYLFIIVQSVQFNHLRVLLCVVMKCIVWCIKPINTIKSAHEYSFVWRC